MEFLVIGAISTAEFRGDDTNLISAPVPTIPVAPGENLILGS